jgi:hypothetical protein
VASFLTVETQRGAVEVWAVSENRSCLLSVPGQRPRHHGKPVEKRHLLKVRGILREPNPAKPSTGIRAFFHTPGFNAQGTGTIPAGGAYLAAGGAGAVTAP